MVPPSLPPSSSLPRFVYGTLLFPEVCTSILGRAPRAEPAALDGWRAAALAGRAYPGLVPARGVVEGRLLVDLGPGERAAVHEFEDDGYDLVEVTLVDGRRAAVYAWQEPGAVLATDWDADRFAAADLPLWSPGAP